MHYILAHGLNVQPTVMQSLAEELGCEVDQCSVITLPGHSEGEELSRDTAHRWLDSFADQYQKAYKPDAKVIFLGYSLGGLLMTYLLGKGQIPAPKKQVLLAPALAFQQWTKIPAYIPNTTLDQVVIPSFTPKNYKANYGVSLGAYKVLFEINRELQEMDVSRINIPTLVLCDRWDELVQAAGLRHFIKAKKLDQWQLYVASSNFWQRLGKKHLLVVSEYHPTDYWDQIRQQIGKFIHE